jgi:antitoxin YefM
VTQAQAGLPHLLKQAEEALITVTRRNEPVAFLVSRERMEAILETMEILANGEAMELITRHEAGAVSFRAIETLDEE